MRLLLWLLTKLADEVQRLPSAHGPRLPPPHPALREIVELRRMRLRNELVQVDDLLWLAMGRLRPESRFRQ